jgi:eukaryotic-like serine/threonine-protein kinase
LPQQAACIGPGTQLGPYRIVAPLGAGGMGQVFVAQDTKLDRKVAVKVIPPGMVGDPSLAIRFEREAKALAALNHPNILSIHDFGLEGDTCYSVTELLEGETLRGRLASGALDTASALRIAREIAEGLSAAHAKGVIHRDLKPANIFLTRDGHVKILDFGLARQEPSTLDVDEPLSEATTRDRSTRPGTILGTVGYMSPEQARGQPTDARTDIFSLGVILYEMLTGARPFAGNSDVDVLAAILRETPTPISRKGLRIPPEVERLTLHCLEKDPASRFQSAGEVAVAIEGLASGSSRAFVLSQLGTKPRAQVVRAVGVSSVVLLSAIALWLGVRGVGGALPPSEPTQITSWTGAESEPSISPDGQSVAFTVVNGRGTDIWVSDVRGGSPIRITSDSASNATPRWFPDGGALVFSSEREGRQGIWKVSRFGGPPNLLLENGRYPAISPDGKRMAFSRGLGGGYLRIWVVGLDDSSRAVELTHDSDGVWDHCSPAWSPDGHLLCYSDQRNLWTIPAAGGGARRLTATETMDTSPIWSPDGRYIYFDSDRGAGWAIWRVPANGGALQRVSLGTGAERWPSLSRDGRRLTYATTGRWTCTLVDRTTGHRHRLSTVPFTGEPSFSPDGGWLACTLMHDDANDIWKIRLQQGQPAGEPERITDHRGRCANVAFSPDGRWIAYYRLSQGRRSVWVVPSFGGPPVAFTEGMHNDDQPEWSPDGKEISFISDRGGRERIWAAPFRDGLRAGPAKLVVDVTGGLGIHCWAPDGGRVAFLLDDGSGSDVWISDAKGSGKPVRLTRGAEPTWLTTDPATGGLLVSGRWGGARSEIRRVPLDGGEPAPLPQISDESGGADIWEVEASNDGRLMALVEQENEGDVWMLIAKAGHF